MAVLNLRNHRPGSAVVAIVLFAAFGWLIAFGRGDWATAGTADADERQRAMYAEATRAAYFAVVTVAVVGFLFELAHGQYGKFGVICSVGGGTQMLTLAWLRRRR